MAASVMRNSSGVSPFSTICFRYAPPDLDPAGLDDLNQRLLDRLNATGEVYLSHTRLHGQLVLRAAIGNLRTTEQHVRRLWQLLESEALRLRPAAQPAPPAG